MTTKEKNNDLYEFQNVTENQMLLSTVTQQQGGNNSLNRPIQTGVSGNAADGPRPLTSVRGAGYTSRGSEGKASLFNNSDGSAGPAPELVEVHDKSPEAVAKRIDHEVNQLLEQSATLSVEKKYTQALAKAKEAGRKERSLGRHREKFGLVEQINVDLTFAVLFNLAYQYEKCDMLSEALNAYSAIVKNREYPNAGRLRVNMGNIYYRQRDYSNAIRNYRMAMDQLGSTSKGMRWKIMRNIGNTFVSMGKFQDAIMSYEAIMDAVPDVQTGFNLILCYYGLGDKEKMKRGFTQLVSIKGLDGAFYMSEEDFEDEKDEKHLAFLSDNLSQLRKEKRKTTEKYILNAAKLIAPVISENFAAGYDWIISYLSAIRADISNHNSTMRDICAKVAAEIESTKGIAFLYENDIKSAIEVFQNFEKKDSGNQSQAATNLSFLYFLKGDLKQADAYSNSAVSADQYNAKALVNNGNVLYERGDYEGARKLYKEASFHEADCIEAKHNLGLTLKKLGHREEALVVFHKVHKLLPSDVMAIYQIATLYEELGQVKDAMKWFKFAHVACPGDAEVLKRLGNLALREGEDTQALHYFEDSYKLFPADPDVVSWLGLWYVKNHLYEEAVTYFKRGTLCEPTNVKWQLLVALCHRRTANFEAAKAAYESIHARFPDNKDCVSCLLSLARDMSDSDAAEKYAQLLNRMDDEPEPPAKDSPGGMGGGEGPGGDDFGARRSSPQRSPPKVASPKVHHNLSGGGDFPPGTTTIGRSGNGKKDTEDDWGDEELGDELLPM